jgi:hypothetical protein
MPNNETEEKKLTDNKIFFNFLLSLLYIIIGGAVFLLIFLLKGVTLISACDAALGAFGVLFGVGSFQIIGNFGTFDALGYNVANLRATWKKGGQKKYKDLYEYTQVRVEKRKTNRFNFVPFYVAAAVYLITSIICIIIFYATL